MLNSMGLGFVFTARDLASAKMQRLERHFTSLDERVTGGTQRMTTAFRQLAVGFAIFTAGAIAVAGAFALANAAGRFEQGIAAVGAVTKATTHELGLLREAAIQAGIQTQFSPDEAVEGLTSLATAGQTATQATRTLIPVLDLAAGSLGQLGVASAAEAVVGTLNAYGMAAEEAAGVTDKLLRITQLTNFQTRDFEGGLAKAVASGAVFSQSLDDTLITMGLLRNRNIDASSSATAYREAVRRVGSDARAQQAILGAGIQVFDQTTGRMRSIVDIMSDFSAATTTMTEEERNRRVATAFGARGLLAFNAVMNASYTTMRDGAEVTLRGADAIEALRHQMDMAGGTAEGFREKLLDTFEGQKTLLQGTLQTFAVVLGEPFAQVFKPIVQAVVETLNMVLRAFQAIPAPIKKVIAGFSVALGGILMLAGGVIAAKATIALLAIGLKALGISLAGILTTFLPVILILGVLAAAVAGFSYAFKKNLGGIADFSRRLWGSVQLFFKGLKQLFEQGGFSGAVRDELARVENQGLKRFLISVYQIAYRIGQVWEGFKAGFTRSIESSAPVFRDLVAALSELGHEIASIYIGVSNGAASLPSSEFRSFGEIAGAAIGTLVRWMTQLIAIVTRVTGGIIGGFKSMMKYIGPAFETVGGAIDDLRQTWRLLTGETNNASNAAESSTASWRTAGEVVGQVLGGIVMFIGFVIAGMVKVVDTILWVSGAIREVFVAVGTAIGEGLGAVVWFLTETLPNALASAWNAVTSFFAGIAAFFSRIGSWFGELFASIASGIKGFLQPVVDYFVGIGRNIKAVFDGIRDFVIRLLRKIPTDLLPDNLERLSRTPLSAEVKTQGQFESMGRASHAVSNAAATAIMPASMDAQVRSKDMAALEASMMSFANGRARTPGQTPPFTVNVQVDGETIAQANHRASSDAAARSFSPVPVY